MARAMLDDISVPHDVQDILCTRYNNNNNNNNNNIALFILAEVKAMSHSLPLNQGKKIQIGL